MAHIIAAFEITCPIIVIPDSRICAGHIQFPNGHILVVAEFPFEYAVHACLFPFPSEKFVLFYRRR